MSRKPGSRPITGSDVPKALILVIFGVSAGMLLFLSGGFDWLLESGLPAAASFVRELL